MKTVPDKKILDKLPPILRLNLEKNLCTCMDVPKMDVINAIIDGAATVEEVKKRTYATMGSGCCIQQVERLIECLTSSVPGKRRSKSRSNR